MDAKSTEYLYYYMSAYGYAQTERLYGPLLKLVESDPAPRTMQQRVQRLQATAVDQGRIVIRRYLARLDAIGIVRPDDIVSIRQHFEFRMPADPTQPGAPRPPGWLAHADDCRSGPRSAALIRHPKTDPTRTYDLMIEAGLLRLNPIAKLGRPPTSPYDLNLPPIPGGKDCHRERWDYLQALRALALQRGTLLDYDEILAALAEHEAVCFELQHRSMTRRLGLARELAEHGKKAHPLILRVFETRLSARELARLPRYVSATLQRMGA